MAVGEEIKVYYDEFVVGRILVHDPQRIGFAYDTKWLDTTGNFSLSVKMPLESGEFDHQVIAPWLANLLPEEQQLVTLSRALGFSVSDYLAILREIGGDTAGAVSIGEPSNRGEWTYEHLQAHYEEDTDSAALNRHFDDLSHRPFLVGEDGVRLSLAGGQMKSALAVLGDDGLPKLGLPGAGDEFAIPKLGAPSTIIVKPNNPILPGIVENEAYCLTLAKMIGIPVVDCMIIKAGSRKALAVARYDRRLSSDGSLKRLHQEDFAQANGIFASQKYEQGPVPGLDLNSLLVTGNHLPPREALKLLDQVIFNILVANTDAHAKNYSMILSEGPRMAPLYDVSSVLHWKHVNQYHAQKIAGRRRKPGHIAKRHWERIAEEAGFNARGVCLQVQELVDAMVAARVDATAIVAGQAGASVPMVHHVAEIIEQNALRIAGRLNGVD